MKNHVWTRLIYCIIIASLLPFFVACDEDEVSVKDLITYDDFLVGTWYRYSFQESSPSNDYMPSRKIFTAGGELNQTTIVLHETTYEEVVTEFEWRIVNGEYRQYLMEDNSIQFQGEFSFSEDSSSVTFSNDSGYVDIYIKEMAVVDTSVVGSWDMIRMTIDGIDQEIGYSPTHIFHMNGSMTLEGSSVQNSWFVNGEYLVLKAMDENLFSDTITKYLVYAEDSRLSMLFNRLMRIDGEFVVQNVAMVFAKQ